MPLETRLTITHIGTATALLELDGLTILTDPYFSASGTEWVGKSGAKMVSSYKPAMGLADLPPLDLILLSHEDHKDNLDDIGRQLLDGRRVFTTMDGARKLHPRPGVQGLEPWQSFEFKAGGHQYTILATPCKHLPGGECTGFVLSAPHFGMSSGKPNAIYFSGDTVHMQALAALRDRFSISVALFCMGKATVPQPNNEMLQITMDTEQGVRLAEDIGAEIVIPVHFEGWSHFRENKDDIWGQMQGRGTMDRFRFIEPGVPTPIGDLNWQDSFGCFG